MSIEFKLQDMENSSDWTGTILHKWGKVLSYSLRSPRKGNTMASGILDYAGTASTDCPLPDTVRVVEPLPNGLGRYALQNAAYEESPLQGAYEFYLKDHLGSTRVVYGVGFPDPLGISPNGVFRAAYDYRSFGEQLELFVFTRKVTENFTGKELDDETSLNYFGARYLDPMLGVWISVDPARQRFSPYTYGSNNPISRIDPNGNADLRVAVFYNYDQYKMPVNGALMVEREISKHINPAYDKVQIRSFGSKSRAEDIVRFLNGADQAAIASHGGWDSEGIYRLGDGADRSFPAIFVDRYLIQQTLLGACNAGDYIEGKPDTKFISPDIATADGLVSSLSEAARYIIQGSDTYQLEQSYSVDFSPSKPAMAPDDME